MPTMKRTHLATGLAACLLSLTTLADAAQAASSAVVIMYHRFGEGEYPATNTTQEQLDAHIQELTSGKYNVLPVAEITRRMTAGEPLPDRTVGITIDDAYRSVYTIAWPKFKAAGLPITIFASTAHLDGGSAQHMTWAHLREMRDGGAGVGHHTVSHLHMVDADQARNAEEIDVAHARFQAELGMRPALFAYPYGEASAAIVRQVKDAGFAAAFGQHSGVIGNTVGRYYLPRFAMNEKYGDLSRLKLALNALPLPVVDVTPPDHLIAGANPPAVGFTVGQNIGSLDQLACFLSHAGRAKLERLGADRIEVRTEQPFPRGRTRLNCTLPGPDRRWRWYGRQFYRP
jgi:peptidoglycan/xylan/chitin deacetylase (PgdA/CDA1 family)